jgi:hypothetical protein
MNDRKCDLGLISRPNATPLASVPTTGWIRKVHSTPSGKHNPKEETK